MRKPPPDGEKIGARKNEKRKRDRNRPGKEEKNLTWGRKENRGRKEEAKKTAEGPTTPENSRIPGQKRSQ